MMSSDSGMLGWHILNGDHYMVEVLEGGEQGMSASWAPGIVSPVLSAFCSRLMFPCRVR